MTGEKKRLTICLVVATVALIVQVAIAIFGHGSLNAPQLICTGVVPVVLLISRLSADKENGDKTKRQK